MTYLHLYFKYNFILIKYYSFFVSRPILVVVILQWRTLIRCRTLMYINYKQNKLQIYVLEIYIHIYKYLETYHLNNVKNYRRLFDVYSSIYNDRAPRLFIERFTIIDILHIRKTSLWHAFYFGMYCVGLSLLLYQIELRNT